MSDIPAWLWIVCTIAAAGMQTLRNAMQRSLTERVGTVGATHVRFLFGLPFGLLFLAGMAPIAEFARLDLSWRFLGWILAGGMCQILATGLMLAAMRERSFVVATAYVKTEPVQIALFGLVFLGERLGFVATTAVLVATAGVLLMSMPARAAALPSPGASSPPAGNPSLPARLLPRAAVLGIASGGAFALSAIGFRGAILALGDAPFYARATVTLAAALTVQTAVLSGWLLWRDRRTLAEIFRLWRPSLLAGAAGALASQMWFLAFSLQSAAAVRTLGLIEILFAQAVSHRLFAQGSSRRETIGMALMIAGLVALTLGAS